MSGATTATYIAAAGLVLSAAGTATSMAAANQQGKAAKAQAAYQAGVMRNNQTVAEWHAQDAIKRGKISEAKQRQATSQLQGRQRAVLAGNGVVVDQDSALDITMDSAELGELDALTIRSNAEREAYGFRVQGANFEADAGLATLKGSNASSAAKTAMFSSAIDGGAQVANKWYGFNKEGVAGF